MKQRLKLSKIPLDVSEAQITTWLTRFGTASNIYIAVKPFETFAFVDLETEEEKTLYSAIATLNKIMIAGCRIKVEIAEPPKMMKYTGQWHLIRKQKEIAGKIEAENNAKEILERKEICEITEAEQKLRKLSQKCRMLVVRQVVQKTKTNEKLVSSLGNLVCAPKK